MTVSAVSADVMTTPDHGAQATVNIPVAGEDAGVIIRADDDASDCYLLTVEANVSTAKVDAYSIYRRDSGSFVLLHSDALTFPDASGNPAPVPAGTDITVRFEVETIDVSTVSITAWAGSSEDNFKLLNTITDVSANAIIDNLRTGIMSKTGGSSSWDDFHGFRPFDYIYFDPANGTARGLGTVDDTCSDLSILLGSVRTSRNKAPAAVYPTVIRTISDGVINTQLLSHERHKGTSWNDAGVIIAGWNKRPILTGSEPEMFEMLDESNYIWYRGLTLKTQSYASPATIIQSGTKHVRFSGCEILIPASGQYQNYNTFIKANLQGDDTEQGEIYLEDTFVDLAVNGDPATASGWIIDIEYQGLDQFTFDKIKFDHVIIRGHTDHAVQIHGNGVINNIDLDHVSWIDTAGDAGNDVHFIVNFDVDPTASGIYRERNSLHANPNKDPVAFGLRLTNSNFNQPNAFVSERNAFHRVTDPHSNISGVVDILLVNPNFRSENTTLSWIESAIPDLFVPSIILPKDWTPTQQTLIGSATDGTAIGAIDFTQPPTTFSTTGGEVSGEIIEFLRPLHSFRRNFRYRYPIHSQQIREVIYEIYKELVILLGVELTDSTIEGLIQTSTNYLDNAIEKQFSVSKENTTNTRPIITMTSQVDPSGNAINYHLAAMSLWSIMNTTIQEW